MLALLLSKASTMHSYIRRPTCFQFSPHLAAFKYPRTAGQKQNKSLYVQKPINPLHSISPVPVLISQEPPEEYKTHNFERVWRQQKIALLLQCPKGGDGGGWFRV